MINLDTNIAEFFGKKTLKGRKFGIEAEYENSKMREWDGEGLTRWRVEPDHSLRTGGIEFVSKPTGMAQVDVALEQMLKVAKIMEAKATQRCGLHVHVNMTDKTFRDLFNVSVLYTLLEPVLFKQYCEGRQESHFCVPTYSNTILVDNMYGDIQTLRRGFEIDNKARPVLSRRVIAPQLIPSEFSIDMAFNTAAKATQVSAPFPKAKRPPIDYAPNRLKFCQTSKYSAMNYSSLKKFGTVEYRQHPSTLSHKAIKDWIVLLDTIHETASLYSDPMDIINMYEVEGLFTLCEKVGLTYSEEIEQYDLEDAVDAATMIAGHTPVEWTELKWEIA